MAIEIIDAKVIQGKVVFADSRGAVWQVEADWESGCTVKLLAQDRYKYETHQLERIYREFYR